MSILNTKTTLPIETQRFIKKAKQSNKPSYYTKNKKQKK
jgi:hypothetical protein